MLFDIPWLDSSRSFILATTPAQSTRTSDFCHRGKPLENTSIMLRSISWEAREEIDDNSQIDCKGRRVPRTVAGHHLGPKGPITFDTYLQASLNRDTAIQALDLQSYLDTKRTYVFVHLVHASYVRSM